MFIFMQKSMIGAIVKIVQLELTADHMKKYQAIWSRSVDDEQLALLMSDGIQFVCPSPQQSSESFPRVMDILMHNVVSFLERKIENPSSCETELY